MSFPVNQCRQRWPKCFTNASNYLVAKIQHFCCALLPDPPSDVAAASEPGDRKSAD